MDYQEVRILTNTPGAELLCTLLEDVAGGFVIDDPQDLEDLMQAPSPRWDYIDAQLVAQNQLGRDVTLSFYLDDSEQGLLALAEVKARLEKLRAQGGAFGPLSLSAQLVRSEDWENNWKQYYKPFSVGPRLLVRPSWEQAQAALGQQVMIMDPASSFGTGSHATTRLCLEALEAMDVQGRAMLDAGCGSGILAIAGLLLGADHCHCCDVEENAVATTARNLAENQIDASRYQVHLGDFVNQPALYQQLACCKYGIITANIVADVLLAMAPHLSAWLEPGGDLLLSGIIDERCDEVLDAYLAQNLVLQKQCHQDGWSLLHLTRP